MGKIGMFFSASFIVGGLVTYWIRNYSATGFALSATAVTLVVIAGIVFVASAIAYVMARRPKETSAQAIERQIMEHRNRAA
jgi:hypothetical protein